MKKFMKSLMLVAVAAMGFTACTNDMLDNVNKNTEETFTLTISSEKPALEGTRTEFSNGSIIWNQGDNIRATFNRGTEWGKYYASTTQSNEIATDGTTAKFTIGSTFTSSGSGDFMFYAGYPQNAIGSGTTAPTGGILGVTVPTEQTMTKMSTFDASADIMVGKSTQTYAEVTQTIPFHWTRLVSHACVTLKNLAAQDGEIVKYVTFTAPEGVALTGEGEVNFVEQSMTALDNNTVTVNLPANTTAKVAELPVWFCSAPATITSGNNLVVTVETTRGTYTRTITARNEGIKFIQNNYCTLGINMAEAEFTPAATSANVYQLITSMDELTTGEYVLAAKYNSAYYPMSKTFGSKINAATTITVTNNQITENDAEGYVLTLTTSSDGVSIYNGTNYLKYSGSSTNFATSTTTSNWTVKYTDNQFQFLQTRYILWQYNSGSPRFGAYATSNWNATGYSGLYLFKKVSNNPDAPTLSLDKNAVEFEHAGGTATITATTTNYDGQITATSSNAHFTTSVNGNVVTVTAPKNESDAAITATITVTAGTLSKSVTVSQGADLGLTGEGSKESPYTVADALKVMTTTASGEIYTKGIICSITEVSTKYGNATYFISDDGQNTNTIQVFRGKYLNNEAFTSADQISVGDEVVIYGKLQLYNGSTPEILNGNYIYSIVKGEAPVALATPVVSATVNGTTVNVSWAAIEGAGSYDVTLGTATKNVTTPSAEFTNVAAGTYTASVVAKPSNTTTHTDSAAGQSASVTVEEQGGGVEESKTYTLLFGSDYNSGNIGSYSNSWSATCDGFTWNITNANNNNCQWNYIKMGSKNAASTGTIVTKTSMPEAIKTVSMTIGAITKAAITSIKLYVATDNAFSKGLQTITATVPSAAGDVVFNIPTPTTNCYYKIEVVCTKNKNGTIQINKVTYAN